MQQYPSIEAFRQNMVNIYGAVEIVRQPLYDYQIYPAAGSAAALSFFSVPAGQGLSSSSGNVANTKHLADTNMQIAGMLPSPQAFYIEGIEVDFQPGSSNAANAYVIQPPSALVTVAASTVQAGENDVNAALSGGVLSLNISNKAYYQEGPLLRFPTQKGFALDAALSTNSATPGEIVKAKMRSVGEMCEINPGLAIMANQSFGVTITYPTAIAMPSAFNGRIGVILRGWAVRPVQ